MLREGWQESYPCPTHGSLGVLNRDAEVSDSMVSGQLLGTLSLRGPHILSAPQGQICAGQQGETWLNFEFARGFHTVTSYGDCC